MFNEGRKVIVIVIMIILIKYYYYYYYYYFPTPIPHSPLLIRSASPKFFNRRMVVM